MAWNITFNHAGLALAWALPYVIWFPSSFAGILTRMRHRSHFGKWVVGGQPGEWNGCNGEWLWQSTLFLNEKGLPELSSSINVNSINWPSFNRFNSLFHQWWVKGYWNGTSHSKSKAVQRSSKRWCPGCENCLHRFTWLSMSKTGPPSSRS